MPVAHALPAPVRPQGLFQYAARLLDLPGSSRLEHLLTAAAPRQPEQPTIQPATAQAQNQPRLPVVQSPGSAHDDLLRSSGLCGHADSDTVRFQRPAACPVEAFQPTRPSARQTQAPFQREVVEPSGGAGHQSCRHNTNRQGPDGPMLRVGVGQQSSRHGPCQDCPRHKC